MEVDQSSVRRSLDAGAGPAPREPLPGDDSALTELGLATALDLERIVADLVAQATPFSTQDRADLTALRDFGPERAPHVAVKENLAVLTVFFPGLDFSASYRAVTDVLRLAVAMAGGDVSLAEPCRFPSFSRAQRRRLLGLLDAVGSPRTAGTAPRRWSGAASGGSGWPVTCAPATTRVDSRAPPRSCARSPPGAPKRVSPPTWRRCWRAATSMTPFVCWPPAPGSSPAVSTTCCDCAPMTPPASAWSPSSPESRPRSPFPSWCACGSTSPPPDRTRCRGGSLPSRRPRAPRRRSSPPPVAPAAPTRRWFAPSRRPCVGGRTWGGSPSTRGCTRATRLRWDCARPRRACARRGAAPACRARGRDDPLLPALA